jgi:hypothetical protein
MAVRLRAPFTKMAKVAEFQPDMVKIGFCLDPCGIFAAAMPAGGAPPTAFLPISGLEPTRAGLR